MAEKLHIEDHELRELLHLMSHDLRNPLAAIVTNLEFAKRMLTRSGGDPDLTESVEDSVTACDVLRRLVANLDLIVKGRDVTVTLQQLEIGKLVQDVVKRCSDRASQAGIELAVGKVDSVSTMLDRNLFALAIENIVSNSIQHGPRRSRVDISVERTDDGAMVRVADQGSPIPEAQRGAALGPEGHTPNGRADGTRYGRGLGLLAARAAATACGCELEVGGDGSNVFTLRIPVLDIG